MTKDGRRVYIGNVTQHTQEKDIKLFFRGYGKINAVFLKSGFAFADFESRRDAHDAAYDLNGKDLLGEKVVVEIARGTPHGKDRLSSGDKVDRCSLEGFESKEVYGPATRTSFRLSISNVSDKVSWQDLKDFMRQAGHVTYADVRPVTINQGVVEFATRKDMLKAIDKLDGAELKGKCIQISEERNSRRSTSSRSSSRLHFSTKSRRKRSRSRSRSRRPTKKSRSGHHRKIETSPFSRRDSERFRRHFSREAHRDNANQEGKQQAVNRCLNVPDKRSVTPDDLSSRVSECSGNCKHSLSPVCFAESTEHNGQSHPKGSASSPIASHGGSACDVQSNALPKQE